MKTVHVVGVNIESADHIGYWNLYPFKFYNAQLKKAGFAIQRTHAQTCDQIMRAVSTLDNPEIIVFRPNWTEPAEAVISLSKKLREMHPNTKLIMADPFDQTNSRFFGALPYLDALLKYQRLKNTQDYLKSYENGAYALDRLAREAGITANKEWDLSSEVEPGQEGKIVTGSFVVEPTLIKQSFSKFYQWRISRTKKDIDIFCHISCGERGAPDWYGKHRLDAIEKLQSIKGYNVSIGAEYAGEDRLSRREYVSRLRRAKIIFAPLGWGEVTMRSYEAAANKCLLIQPDVGHMDIFPNVFMPNKTYIPVKWDLSDLVEKCTHYLEHEQKRAEITENALIQLKNEYLSERFVKSCISLFES